MNILSERISIFLIIKYFLTKRLRSRMRNYDDYIPSLPKLRKLLSGLPIMTRNQAARLNWKRIFPPFGWTKINWFASSAVLRGRLGAKSELFIAKRRQLIVKVINLCRLKKLKVLPRLSRKRCG